MSENIKNDPLAKCGMDCKECRFAIENNCPGCPYILPPEKRELLSEDEECEVGICCEGKGFENCSCCTEFPCDILKDVSFDLETGDGGSRLLHIKELADKESAEKWRKISFTVSGAALGACTGLVIGTAAAQTAAWVIAGIIVGIGLGAIIGISADGRRKVSKRKKRK
ncbi:MAG: DUF3795 domain-containing protein [Huintestinicola sp.]